jgi:hypothetical protein
MSEQINIPTLEIDEDVPLLEIKGEKFYVVGKIYSKVYDRKGILVIPFVELQEKSLFLAPPFLPEAFYPFDLDTESEVAGMTFSQMLKKSGLEQKRLNEILQSLETRGDVELYEIVICTTKKRLGAGRPSREFLIVDIRKKRET